MNDSHQSQREEAALCVLCTGNTVATHPSCSVGKQGRSAGAAGALSVRHVLTTCSGYNRERTSRFSERQRPLTMAEMIGHDSDKIAQVLNYLDAIDDRTVCDQCGVLRAK